MNLLDLDEGVPRDELLRWPRSPDPRRWQFRVDGPDGYPVALTAVNDTTLRAAENLPPWRNAELWFDGVAVRRFQTGADLAGDPARIVAWTPGPIRALSGDEALELRFGQRLDPAALPEVAAVCAQGAALSLRWHWQRRGARARLEPLGAWPAGPCRIDIRRLRTPAGLETGAQLEVDVATGGPGMRISELIVDPQQDWSDEQGVPWAEPPGSGSVGSGDEYIELVNVSAATVDLRGWRIEMLDGTDAVIVIGETNVAVRATPAWVDVSAVPPCAVLVFGDPPGQMNNEIVVRLVRPDGLVVDRMHLTSSSAFAGLPGTLSRSGGGRASSPADEAVFPAWVTGPGAPLLQGPASPGQAPCTG